MCYENPYTPQNHPTVVLDYRDGRLSGKVILPGAHIAFGHRITDHPASDEDRTWADYQRLFAGIAGRYWFAGYNLPEILAALSGPQRFARCLPLPDTRPLESAVKALAERSGEFWAASGYSEYGLDPIDLARTGLFTVREIAGFTRMDLGAVAGAIETAILSQDLEPISILPDFRHAELAQLHGTLTRAGSAAKVAEAAVAAAQDLALPVPDPVEVWAYRRREVQSLRASRARA